MAVLDTLRRPAYTGDNRCWPCTVVNAVLVAAATLAAAVVWWPAAVAVCVVGAAAIALRGYVIPYTPRVAPRLVAAVPTRPTTDGGADAVTDSDALATADVDGDHLMEALFAAGVLVERSDGLALAAAFRDDWEAEMATLRARADADLAAAVADAAAFEGRGRVAGDGVTVDGDDRTVWLSRPLAIAETAAVRALAAYDVAPGLRPAAAQPLRLFLEACPRCGDAVVETSTDECCGGTSGVYDTPTDDVLACASCDAVVFVFDD